MASFQQAFEHAAHGKHVIGWRLDGRQRDELLGRIRPRYERVVADHVTLREDVSEQAGLPDEHEALAVGQADDGQGVQAVVVEIGGTTERPDGGRFHLTWSLGADRSAQESNAVIAEHGWQPFDPPVPLRIEPARFP